MTEMIKNAASIITAVIALGSVIFAAYRWYLRQNKQDSEIKRIKEENTLICYALSACLDGLIQLGADSTVSQVKDRLDKHLNKSAHI